MKNIRCMGLLLSILLVLSCAGCTNSGSTKSPITLTIWHVYGGQTDSPLNDLIARFNSTVGKEQGINLVVTAVADTNNIHESVLAAAKGDPGAPTLPDLFISYPKTITALDDSGILVDFHEHFTEEELSAYIPAFLDEGIFDGKLLIFPVAKSTELLFINKTLFDRFSAETGASLDNLATWEGVFETACLYADWTDAQTPHIAGDGKAFISHDYLFHYMQVGVESLGADFWTDEELSFDRAYERVWEPMALAGIKGGLWLEDGYVSSGPMRTGEVIAGIGSSASVLYHSKTVTYLDNTTEEVEIISLPCPVFENGQKMVMQRGAGFCAVTSTPEKERVVCTFLRWLTEPAQNTEFVTSVGYLPVTEEAYETWLEPALAGLTEPAYIGLYQTVLEMQPEYTFYTPPSLPQYLDVEETVADSIRLMLKAARREYQIRPEAPVEQLIRDAYKDFYNNVNGYPVG